MDLDGRRVPPGGRGLLIPWPVSSMTWYIWYPATAAYTLGPAYQVEAAARVTMDARAGSGARSHTSLVKGR